MNKRIIGGLLIVLTCQAALLFAQGIPQGSALMTLSGDVGARANKLVLVRTPSMDTVVLAQRDGLDCFAILPQSTFSPDGRQVAFFVQDDSSDTKLSIRVIDNDGTNGRKVASTAMTFFPAADPAHLQSRYAGLLGIDWAENGYLYWGEGDRNVYRVRASGGERELLIATHVRNVFHLSISNDAVYAGMFQIETGVAGYLLEAASGTRWRFDGTYCAVSPDGSTLLELPLQVAPYAWGAQVIVHSVAARLEGASVTAIDTLGAFEASADHPNTAQGAARFNQMRFASNSNDHFVATGDSGLLANRVFLHSIPDDLSWEVTTPESWAAAMITDWWMGELPEPGGVAARELISTRSNAAQLAPFGTVSVGTLSLGGAGGPVLFFDVAGRVVGGARVSNGNQHPIAWQLSKKAPGFVLVVPVNKQN